jgi:hypothetical protein
VASAGLCRLNQASLGCDSQLSKENTPGHENQFGIIRKAALFAGNGPATVELFRNLWGVDALPKIQAPGQIGQQSSLFDRS